MFAPRGVLRKLRYVIFYLCFIGLFVFIRYDVRTVQRIKTNSIETKIIEHPRDYNQHLASPPPAPALQAVKFSPELVDFEPTRKELAPKVEIKDEKGARQVNTDPVQGPRFSHPLHPEYPLIGELVNPVPGLQLGDIGKGADIVIGIPTVKRKDVSYLESTLTSLFDKMFENPNSPTDISVKVLVFIGEVDEEFVKQKMMQLNQEFPKQIESKVLEVISVPTDYYPQNWAESLHLQFGDPLERTKWRSKQNLDQVFLMMYIYNLNPKYYLMLEDDVIAKQGYADHIMKFAAENESKDWFYLSFCILGAIGKLFRARTLPSYASFIHTFWNRKPLDWLQNDYVSTQVCSYDEPHANCIKLIKTKLISYTPSQFQHLGKISSLEGKKQLLVDKSFGRRPK